MKKLLLILCSIFLFTSCSSDDEKNNEDSILSEQIIGQWKSEIIKESEDLEPIYDILNFDKDNTFTHSRYVAEGDYTDYPLEISEGKFRIEDKKLILIFENMSTNYINKIEFKNNILVISNVIGEKSIIKSSNYTKIEAEY